jgi:hypothetical protein
VVPPIRFNDRAFELWRPSHGLAAARCRPAPPARSTGHPMAAPTGPRCSSP